VPLYGNLKKTKPLQVPAIEHDASGKLVGKARDSSLIAA
jgi:hypothetical protein